MPPEPGAATVSPAQPLPPALAVRHGEAVMLDPGAEAEFLSAPDALNRLSKSAYLVAHAGLTMRRLGADARRRIAPPCDVLELFLFARPAQPVVPSARGLAQALCLRVPMSLEEEARLLCTAAALLLEDLRRQSHAERDQARMIAAEMAAASWPWAPWVLAALGPAPDGTKPRAFPDWPSLPDWEAGPPPPKTLSRPIALNDVSKRLSAILGPASESRTGQRGYAAFVAEGFAPRDQKDHPIIVLAEAGTGIGKTAGYLAPGLTWSDLNGHGLTISTYTKALQRQLMDEFRRIYPNPEERNEKVAIRKGRENYLCLLNFDEVAQGRRLLGGPEAITLGLVARWAHATADGDLISGSFPAWAWPSPGLAQALTLKAGECIYAACPHYRRCLIESAQEKARQAPIVIANHALIMTEASAGHFRTQVPARLILDEGHMLFHAADDAFATHVTGSEGAMLRRWVRGPQNRRMRFSRGLKERLSDFTLDDRQAEEWADEVVARMRDMPDDGWLSRISGGEPRGTMERFLSAVREQVLARTGPDNSYGLQCETGPLTEPVAQTAEALRQALTLIVRPMHDLIERLKTRLTDDLADGDSGLTARLDRLIRSLEARGLATLLHWQGALESLTQTKPAEFVDWFAIERQDGRDIDVGLYRHWIDPTRPMAELVYKPSHGVVVTSATLRDRGAHSPDTLPLAAGLEREDGASWNHALERLGPQHITATIRKQSFASPFDYASATRVFVVTDNLRGDPDRTAAAYRALFLASGGGALGLFTSIRALRQTHERLVRPLAEHGMSLYAQHSDGLEAGTLVDLFRDDESSCLLGTDSLRDGIDVPGSALRLVVFNQVPWPQPDILHKARRAHFGKAYEDAIVRGRITQAFGRIVRRAGDRGIFVVLDPRTPSRLLSGLPDQTPVTRCPLQQACEQIHAFFSLADTANSGDLNHHR